MFRALLKRSAEVGIAGTGLWRVVAAARRPPDLVLAYHNVVPDGAPPWGDRSLHLPRNAFGRQLDALLETHDVVPLADLLDGTRAARPRPRGAVTFDDAYRGAVTCGLEELGRRGLPATIFIAPGLVGGGPFWWDRVAGPRGEVPDAFRTRALEDLGGDASRVLRAAGVEGPVGADMPDHALPASEAELRAAAQRSAVTFGSHSWSHPNLAALPEEALARELSASLEWLRARFTRVVPYLAYPYGLSSPRVRRGAAAAGYAAALAVTGGALRPGWDVFGVPRLSIPAGMSAAGLTLRACGLIRE